MATHSSVLAWRIPGTGEPGGLPSVVYGVTQSRRRLKRRSSSSAPHTGIQTGITWEYHSRFQCSGSHWPEIVRFMRAPRIYSPWNSPGQNTGVGSHFLLQGGFPTQGSNQGLPHSKRILHRLSHQGSPVSIDKVFAKVSQTVSQRWSTGFCPGNPLS